MATTQSTQLKLNLDKHLAECGWSKDRFGYMVKQTERNGETRKFRINPKERVVSLEVWSDAKEGYAGRWVRIYSTSWKNVKIHVAAVVMGTYKFTRELRSDTQAD